MMPLTASETAENRRVLLDALDAGPDVSPVPIDPQTFRTRRQAMTTLDDRTMTPARISAKNWRSFAACRNSDEPDVWFPIGNTGSALTQIEKLKSFCIERCPVVEFCRDWALDTNQEAGVWGAMSEDERRALKRREARQRQRAAAGADETAEDEQVLAGLESS